MLNTYHIFYLISPSFEEEIPDYRTLLGSTYFNLAPSKVMILHLKQCAIVLSTYLGRKKLGEEYHCKIKNSISKPGNVCWINCSLQQ